MEFVRFGELYSIPSGNGLSRPSAVRGEGYRMIGMGELFAKDIISDMEMDRVQMSECEKKTFLVESGDLLFARQSLVAEGAGKCSIVKDLSEPTTFESHLIRVRLNKQKCNPWYFFYLFRLPDNPIKAIVNQCAQAGIRGNELLKIKVPLPERKIQDRIANVLSDYDNLIEVNNKRIKVLEQMAENLYKEWFVRFRFPGHENAKFENGIPKGWRTAKLKELAIEVDTPEKPENKGNYTHYLPIDKLPSKAMTIFEEDSIVNAESSLIAFKKGDILFGAMRPYFHKVIIAPFDGLTRTTCFVINTSDSEYRLYLYLLLFQTVSIDYATTVSVGSTMPYARWKDFSEMSIVIPNIDTVIKFNQVIEPIFDRLIDSYSIVKNLIKQRDLLLPRLMSGKIEV